MDDVARRHDPDRRERHHDGEHPEDDLLPEVGGHDPRSSVGATGPGSGSMSLASGAPPGSGSAG